MLLATDLADFGILKPKWRIQCGQCLAW